MIIPKYYEGYPGYDKSKFIWARINVPTKQQKPTYILIRKRGKVIGGAVITHQYIYAKILAIKIKLGILHEIFLDKNKFNNHRNMFFGYIYLIDKIIKAATRRSIGVLIFKSTSKDKDLNQAFKGLNFLTIRDSVIMVKELKSNLKFPQIKAPLYIPTYVSLGFP